MGNIVIILFTHVGNIKHFPQILQIDLGEGAIDTYHPKARTHKHSIQRVALRVQLVDLLLHFRPARGHPIRIRIGDDEGNIRFNP